MVNLRLLSSRKLAVHVALVEHAEGLLKGSLYIMVCL